MLEYHVSGEEPKIVAGSRRGFPLRAKGIYNTAEKDFQGHYITKEWLDSFDKSGSMSGKELLERVRCEMEYAYYDVLLQEKYPKINREILLADVVNSKTPKAVIEQSAIKPADRFVFREELRPEVKYRNSNRQDVMLDYLTYDVQTAQKGTKTGPIAAALEVLRAIRNDIREIVDRRLLSGGDYYNYVLGEFKREDSYLAVGPPDQRIEELRALVKAGVVTILGPEMAVDFDEESKQFETWSKTYPEEKYLADYLVEARLPSINANTSKNPLIRSLFDQGLAESQKVDVDGDSKETGSVSIDVIHETLTPSAVQDTGLFFWGVPTEGEHWFTTTSPHPGLPDTVIKGADRIAAQIFEFPFDKNK